MSELSRLHARGLVPTVACRTVADWQEEYFAEQCRWASQVDDLNDEIDACWRTARHVRLAWSCAAVGWLFALLVLWRLVSQ